MKEVEINLLQWQYEVLHDMVSDVTCVSAGYGSGKTFLTVLWCIERLAQNPGCDGIYIEPIYRLIKTVAFPAFEEVLELLGYVHKVHYRLYRSADNPRIEFCTGQTIYFLTGETPENIIGMTYVAFGVIDEAASTHHETLTKLRSRLRNRKAKKIQVLLSTTPEGLNWVADMFDSDVLPDWFLDEKRRNTHRKLVETTDKHGEVHTSVYTRVRVETYDNEDNLDPSYIPNLIDTWGFNQAYIDSYIYGYFRPFATGLAYSNFKGSMHTTPPVAPTTTKPVHLSWDFNICPTWVTIQHKREEVDRNSYKNVYQVYECSDGDAETLDEAILEFAAKHPRSLFKETPIYVYGDASGHNRSHKVKGSDYDNIVRVLKRLGYKYVQVVAIKANPLERTSVDLVQAAFADNILRIGSNCGMVLKSLTRTVWKDGKRANLNKPSNDTWTHPMDAVKYFFCAIERNSRRKLMAGR